MKIQQKKYWLFILTAIVSASLILLFSFSFDIFQKGDNCGYISLGIAFAEGKGFTNPALPGSIHFLWWPPGFPLFISLFYKVIGPHWCVLKLLIFLTLYISFTLYAVMLYKEEKNIIKPALILIAICFSSGIHLISSYLYSETFFVACTLLFFFLWHRWRKNLTFLKIVALSLFSLYISTIRLIGISLPTALTFYLLISVKKEQCNRWYGVIPGLLLAAFVMISLFVPPLRIGSLRVIFGLHPQFAGSIIAGGYTGKTVTVVTIIGRYINKTIMFFRGYGLSLIPQALIRSAYDLYEMNKLKSIIMAFITTIVVTGWFTTLKKYRLMNIYVFLFMSVLFVYGPLYVRLLIPIIPFLFLYFYSGLETIIGFFIKKKFPALSILSLIWMVVIFDNAFRTFTDPHRTMPPKFGDDAYQECIEWVVDNTKFNDVVVSQIYSYLYLRRGKYCIPYINTKTPNEFMAYLDIHSVKYIAISPFYKPQETYMRRAIEAENTYPDSFKKVFGKNGDESYILEYFQSEISKEHK